MTLRSNAHAVRESRHVLAALLFFAVLALIPTTSVHAQWLDWVEATNERLVLSTVANSDDQEKDAWAADFNNDGWQDVIFVRKTPFSGTSTTPRTDLLLMNIGGVLTDMTAQYAPGFITTPTHARDVYVDDFDGDGWVDIVIANTFNQQPKYYRNLGESGGQWQGFADESAARFPLLTEDALLFCAVWGGDVDGNGTKDLYFCNYKQNASGGIAQDFLLMNDGNGFFTNESQARLGNLRNSAFGTAVQIVDIDNDGDLDILKVSTLYNVAPWNAMGLFALYNNGDGTFTNWQNLQPGSAPYMFEAVDLNGDEWLDIYIVDDAADRVIYLNGSNPNNSVSYTQNILNYSSTNGFGGNVHAYDLDLDGTLDIGVADVDVDIPPCDSGRRMAIYRNSNGSITDPYGTSAQPWADNAYDFWFLDINNDGLPDLITGDCSGYSVYMSANCELAPNSSDYDGDGLADACDPCPTNPDPNCTPPTDFPVVSTDFSMARQWNELALASIRKDLARPPVHARNLFHLSAAQWDAWSAYDPASCGYILGQELNGHVCTFEGFPLPDNIEASRDTAIAYASYRILRHRFVNSPQAALLYQGYDNHMATLGYDPAYTSTDYAGGSAAALGNYVAQCVINYGLNDNANETINYGNQFYEPVNEPMNVDIPGNDTFTDFNRWQPLTLALFIDQSGNVIPGDTPDFLGPEWGQVHPFSLNESDRVDYTRDGNPYPVYLDPGAPPMHQMDGGGTTEDYRWSFVTTAIWASHLDPTDGVMWDISPGALGNNSTFPTSFADHPNYYDQMNGGNDHNGHPVNPVTGQPYAPNIVPRADYARVLAEFWADGPDSETPPGHWFSIFNYVSDHPMLEKRIQGEGDVLSDLEWDVKGYLALGGAMHDAAVAAWGVKGWYDYPRPISAIRGMAELGQSSFPGEPNYHPGGLPIVPGYIEVIQPGEPLAGAGNIHAGKLKMYSWRGHNGINNVDTEFAGVGWIRAEDWEPYQRPTFVTPPFAGYVSGHSTFSRAAAELLTQFTGSEYFPGGIGEFVAQANEFLVFEDGPSVDVVLQWATYYDAADESGASRIWGGIHPPADDIPGRIMGDIVGQRAFAHALQYFESQACTVPEDCAPTGITASANCQLNGPVVEATITVNFGLSAVYCSADELCYREVGSSEYTCIVLSGIGDGDSYTVSGLNDNTAYEVYFTVTDFAVAPQQSTTVTVTTGNCSAEVPGCTDPIAVNYNSNATFNDGSCSYNCGSNVPLCVDTNGAAFIAVITANNACCIGAWDAACQAAYDALTNLCIAGCTNALACNFNPNAGNDDGSCTYPGCTDPLACNYDATAGCDDASCTNNLDWYTDLDGDGYGTGTAVASGSCDSPCDNTWVINVTGTGWLDETTWTFTDASGVVVAAGGPYDNNGGGGTFTGQGVSTNGPFTFAIETQGQFNDNVANWIVSTGSGLQLASGGVTGGQTGEEADIDCSLASQTGDCDDANPDVNPGQIEDPCNDIDDNCNGEINEGGGTVWYADADGDGFGNPEVTLISCAVPCDDTWVISVTSGGWMDEISWSFADVQGTVVAAGGPYPNTEGGGNFTSQGISGNGPFTFTIETQGQLNDNSANWSIASGSGLQILSGFAAAGTESTIGDIDCIYVDNADDCNDADANVNPSVADSPCNGIDDNCDGIVDDGSIFGCTDADACNYDPSATCDNNSCDLVSCFLCPGDFNFDGNRDVQDLLILLGDYACTGVCAADMNGDQMVTASDMLMFLPLFGLPCPQ